MISIEVRPGRVTSGERAGQGLRVMHPLSRRPLALETWTSVPLTLEVVRALACGDLVQRPEDEEETDA